MSSQQIIADVKLHSGRRIVLKRWPDSRLLTIQSGAHCDTLDRRTAKELRDAIDRWLIERSGAIPCAVHIDPPPGWTPRQL